MTTTYYDPPAYPLPDGFIFVPAVPLRRSSSICQLVQPDEELKIRNAGVKALRCNYKNAGITTYPTKRQDIEWLQAVHVAVRTGDFNRIVETYKNDTEEPLIFGLFMKAPVYAWLKKAGPGGPLADIVQFLNQIARRNWSGGEEDGWDLILEAQLESSVAERVYNLTEVRDVPDFFEDSKDHFFEVDIGTAYLSASDWVRIVKRGENDNMLRTESRSDVWDLWSEASRINWEHKGHPYEKS